MYQDIWAIQVKHSFRADFAKVTARMMYPFYIILSNYYKNPISLNLSLQKLILSYIPRNMKRKVLKKQQISKMCFVCGEKNNFGLHASFYETEDNELVALINPSEEHQGYPGRMHGGIAASILDETIERSINAGREGQIWGVTLELKTRFRKPIPLNEQLKVIGRVTNEGNRYFEGTGEILLANGEIAVSAEGKYLKADLSKVSGSLSEDDWFRADGPGDPAEIEIP